MLKAKQRYIKAQTKEFELKKRGKDEWDKEYDTGKLRKIKKKNVEFGTSARAGTSVLQADMFQDAYASKGKEQEGKSKETLGKRKEQKTRGGKQHGKRRIKII